MESEVFKAGTRYGAPTTQEEIKILICYILSEVKSTMSFSQIHEALSEHELVNYFELVSAVDSLLLTGHVAVMGEPAAPEAYAITDFGKNAAETIHSLLPVSVREKAAAAAGLILRRAKREREVIVRITELDEGCEVFLALPGGESHLISFTVFCPTMDEAEILRKRFFNDPVYIYKGVTALLSGDKDVMGEIFPSQEDLYYL